MSNPFEMSTLDTTTWNVEDHLDWIHQYASDAREMAQKVVSWQIDALKVRVGMAKVVEWPDDGPGDPGTRVIFHGGYAYLIKDV